MQFALFYYDSITAELLGSALEGAIVTHSYGITIDTPLNKSFIKRYHERHKNYPSTHMQYPDSFFGNAYFGMMFLFAAVEKAGSLDPEKIIKAWEGMQFEYPQGKVTMRACDHQLIAPMSIFKVVKVPAKDKFFNVPYYISKPVITFTGEETAIPMNAPGYNPRCK
jgi:ABC-type branched-subunit amino acid transport system substrate-binding protein